jgi:hypothetical protein
MRKRRLFPKGPVILAQVTNLKETMLSKVNYFQGGVKWKKQATP